MALTVEATKKVSYVVVASVLLILAAGVLVVGHPWSDVGRSGIVSVTLSSTCANADDVSFDGSGWMNVPPIVVPESWGRGPVRGRFTIRTPNTAEFVSDGDHFALPYVRTHKGQLSSLPCLIP